MDNVGSGPACNNRWDTLSSGVVRLRLVSVVCPSHARKLTSKTKPNSVIVTIKDV